MIFTCKCKHKSHALQDIAEFTTIYLIHNVISLTTTKKFISTINFSFIALKKFRENNGY